MASKPSSEADPRRCLELFSDDVITYRADPDGATLHGKAGFRDAVADWTEDFSEWQLLPQEFTDLGERVLVQVLQIAARKKQRRPCGGGLVVPLRADRQRSVEAQLLFQPRRGPRKPPGCRSRPVASVLAVS